MDTIALLHRCQSRKRPNSEKYYRILQNLFKSSTFYTYSVIKYHSPSLGFSPDTLLIRFHRFAMHKSEKGHNSETKIRGCLFFCSMLVL